MVAAEGHAVVNWQKMAHLVIMASIPAEKVAAIGTPKDITAFASRTAFCSHWAVQMCPAAAEVLDGGVPLVTKMWHPVRGPAVHAPESVPQALARLEAATRKSAAMPAEDVDWVISELSRAVELYRHASQHGQAVVSMLDLTRTGPRLSKGQKA